MESDIGRSLDRISKLPDSILCHILSFLPTKDAVGTSILSTRWQDLWTSVATLDFDDSELFPERPETTNNGDAEVDLGFMNFVNTVLLLSDVSCLETFSLKLESFCNFDIIKAWISAVVKRNVQRLELSYSMFSQFYGEIPIQLPRMLFTCKTLVDLTLDGNIYLKVPDLVWLPSLKILNIEDVIYENGDSAQKLFYGCPILEDLRIGRLHVGRQKLLNISVPTLMRLEVTHLGYEGGDQLSALESIDDSNEKRHKLVVNAPKLEYLRVTDFVAEEFSLENLSSLSVAHIAIGSSPSGPVSSTNILKLLRGIANVKFLSFVANVKDYVLPTFHTYHNLTHLRLWGVENGWNLDLLKEFLEYSPNLEVLILEGNRVVGSAKFWSPSPQVPRCLLARLKEIEILNFGRKNYEFEAIKTIEYLLKSAEVLMKMTIECQDSDCRVIAQFPWGSKECRLYLL